MLKAFFSIITGIPYPYETSNRRPQPDVQFSVDSYVFRLVMGGYLWQKKLILQVQPQNKCIKYLYMVMKQTPFGKYTLLHHNVSYDSPQEAIKQWYNQVGKKLFQCQTQTECLSLLQDTDKYYAIFTGRAETNMFMPGFYSL